MLWWDWQWWNTVSNIAFVINIVLAGFIVVYENKRATSVWAWLMVLFFLPVVGFFLYLLFGRTSKSKKWSGNQLPVTDRLLKEQMEAFKQNRLFYSNSLTEKFASLIYMLLKNDDSPLSQDNQIHIYTDAHNKFEALFQDILAAKDHIHLQYYIVRKDKVGRQLRDLLTEKAKQGVDVRFLYDGVGSRKIGKDFFAELHKHGGEARGFSPVLYSILRLRLNFRNHRKIAVIDGKAGYIGGFNVGDEYLGRNEKFGYWRDTHLRTEGNVVHLLQERFISDWNKAGRKSKLDYTDRFFPPPASNGDVPLQVVSSGPDASGGHVIHGFIKVIQEAEDYIYIQTPYFIPDPGLFESLCVAALSGIDVRIMVPNKPDHPFVHSATLSFAGELMKAGAEIYTYEEGFLHAKSIVVDDKVVSVGTANVDIRSAQLNFEVNTFIYHKKVAEEMREIFHLDMESSTQFTEEMYQNRSFYKKVKESVSRLVSPLL